MLYGRRVIEKSPAHDRRQFKWGSRHDLSKLAQNSVILATYDRLRQLGVDQLPLFQPLPLAAVPVAAPIAAAVPIALVVPVAPVVPAPVVPPKRGRGRPKKIQAQASNGAAAAPAAANVIVAAPAPAAAAAPALAAQKYPWMTIPFDCELRDRSSSK